MEKKTANSLYEQGLSQMRKQLGPEAEQYLKPIRDIAPFFEKMNVEFPYGTIYRRENELDLKTRELCTVAALTALGHCAPQLKLHIEASLRVGASPQDIIEVICQMVAYVGFPLATQALMTAKSVFDEQD